MCLSSLTVLQSTKIFFGSLGAKCGSHLAVACYFGSSDLSTDVGPEDVVMSRSLVKKRRLDGCKVTPPLSRLSSGKDRLTAVNQLPPPMADRLIYVNPLFVDKNRSFRRSYAACPDRRLFP